MAYNRSMVFVLTVLLCMAAASSFAMEELFDTATASKHMEQGVSHLKAKDYDAAINAFDESAEVAPEAEAFYYLGYAYYMKGRKAGGESRKLSLENFEKAYEIDPHFSPTRYRIPEPTPELATEPSTTEAPAPPELATGLSMTEEPASPQLAADADEMQPDVPEAPTPEQEQPTPED
jgi:tetratricopeptide (TPR) repeat protein